MTNTTLTPVTELAVGDLIDFFPILDGLTSDADLYDSFEATKVVSESEYFLVEEIVVYEDAVLVHTDNVSWSFPLDDKVPVAND